MSKIHYLIIAVFLFGLPFQGSAASTDRHKSPLYRDYRSPYPNFIIRGGDPDLELQAIFSLIRKANAGDPIAQSDLGVCYLEGLGTVPDTVKAAYWTMKAAGQNHAVANYNMSVFYTNGWGVPWNPFLAYQSIKFAAEAGMKEAQYFLCRFLIEDLVVPRNIPQAYYWIKVSADSGFAPSQEILQEFVKRGWVPEKMPAPDTAVAASNPKKNGKQKAAIAPVFLDFSHDTVAHPSYQTLVREAMQQSDPKLQAIAESLSTPKDTIDVDSTMRGQILLAAERGSPEALLLAGQWCEQGKGARRDAVLAAAYYARAMRLDSPRAPRILWELSQEKEFYPLLKKRVDVADPVAEYVWSELISLGFDHSITDEQAWAMLEQASRQQYVPALVAEGIHYIVGSWVGKNQQQALRAWGEAKDAGNAEAGLRITMTRIFDGKLTLDDELRSSLEQAAGDGAILAQTLLGYCYEKGVGVPRSPLIAARYYRMAAGRGSSAALEGLRSLYDALRPASREFHLEN